MSLLRKYYPFFSEEMEYDEFVKMVSEKRKLYGNLYDEETIVFYFLAKKGILKDVLENEGFNT
ncbi:MAG: hypothetical protein QW620_06190 [Thermoplasmata archaeon]